MERLHRYISKLFYLPRISKQFMMIAFDIFAVVISVFFVHWLLQKPGNDVSVFLATTAVALVLNGLMRLYTSVIRHLSLRILFDTALSATLTGFAYGLFSMWFLKTGFSLRSVLIFALGFYVLVSGVRLLVRSYYFYRHSSLKENVIIYGAGDAGQQLAASLIKGNEFSPVAFIDDNPEMHDTYMSDVKVYAANALGRIIKNHKTSKIFLALPSISRAVRQHIINTLEPYRIEVQSIPGMADIISGKMKIDQLQDVSIDDLLGRDAVPPKPELFAANIKGKVVMVTGAGGSIGSELCRQIFHQQPKQLLLFELSEFSLYAINRELSLLKNDLESQIEIIPLLGSVQNKERIASIFSEYKVDTIYHAAAYKHVPLVEYNTIEGIENNIFGTRAVAEAAIEYAVDTFVLVSTDKAVRPTNVMGTTKRFAELILQALAADQDQTRFCMVRFGNVLGSSGSVVPLFKQQIRSGGPVTVTHKDITRFFMTIPEAAQLVIQAGAMGKGGDVFVLDMGDSVKIADLARKMVRLMGLETKSGDNPEGDIEIIYTGLRPGEKLYEELLIGTNVQGTDHPRIMTADEVFLDKSKLYQKLTALHQACMRKDFAQIRSLLIDAPTGYQPSSEICDHLANEKNVIKSDSVVVNFKPADG